MISQKVIMPTGQQMTGPLFQSYTHETSMKYCSTSFTYELKVISIYLLNKHFTGMIVGILRKYSHADNFFLHL